MPPKSCVVCSQIGEGWHFGAFVCRPCASFYRRTMAENKTYTCRLNNQCPVSRESRNCCRACRLKKCLENGMKCPPAVVATNDPITAPSSSASSSEPQLPVSPPEPVNNILTFEHQPALRKANEFIKSFYNSVKSIYACENPGTYFSAIDWKPITREDFLRLEQSYVSILAMTLSSYFPFFENKTQAFKGQVLDSITFALAGLTKMLLTYQYFPDDEDKIVINYGYYMDITRPEMFFGESDRHMYSYYSDAIKLIQVQQKRYSKSGLVELDIGVLSAMIFLMQLTISVIKHDPSNVEAQNFKTQLIAEYHAYMTSLYGFERGIQLYTERFLLIADSTDCCHRIRESLTLLGLFSTEPSTKNILTIFSSHGNSLLNKNFG